MDASRYTRSSPSGTARVALAMVVGAFALLFIAPIGSGVAQPYNSPPPPSSSPSTFPPPSGSPSPSPSVSSSVSPSVLPSQSSAPASPTPSESPSVLGDINPGGPDDTGGGERGILSITGADLTRFVALGGLAIALGLFVLRMTRRRGTVVD